MDNIGCLNVFISEGAFLKEISNDIESRGDKINKDASITVELHFANPTVN